MLGGGFELCIHDFGMFGEGFELCIHDLGCLEKDLNCAFMISGCLEKDYCNFPPRFADVSVPFLFDHYYLHQVRWYKHFLQYCIITYPLPLQEKTNNFAPPRLPLPWCSSKTVKTAIFKHINDSFYSSHVFHEIQFSYVQVLGRYLCVLIFLFFVYNLFDIHIRLCNYCS